MIALAIMGVLFAAVFALQSQITKSVRWVTQRFDRTIQARTFLTESAIKAEEKDQEEVVFEQTVSSPPTKMVYKKSKVAAEGQFAKRLYLYKHQVTMTWQEGITPRHDALLLFAYQPPKKNSSTTKDQATPVKPQGANR